MSRPREFNPDVALERAMKLFWKQGYESTSIQDLVDFMGINRFSLYDTFGSKHQLFMKALDRYRDEVVTDGLRMLEGPEAGLPAIELYFKSALAMSEPSSNRAGCLMTNCAVEMAAHDEELASKVRAHLERLENAFHRQLRQARRDGELESRQNLRDLARYLTGAAQGLGVLVKVGQDRKALRGYVNVVLGALRKAVNA